MNVDAPNRWTPLLDKIGIPVRIVAHVLGLVCIITIGFVFNPQADIVNVSVLQWSVRQLLGFCIWYAIVFLFARSMFLSMLDTPSTIQSLKWAKFGIVALMCIGALIAVTLLGK